jgi:TonB family protein
MERGNARLLFFIALSAVMTFVSAPQRVVAQEVQDELTKRVKARFQPTYPELAQRMSVRGSVKLMVTVGSNGKVKTTKVMGGHPLLVVAAEDAIRRWKFEPASEETTGLVEFKFAAAN